MSQPDKQAQRCSTLIGIGLVLLVVYQPDQPFLSLIFLPVVGTLLVFVGAASFLLNSKFDAGPKALWIPLAVIAGSIILRPVYALVAKDVSQWGMKAEWAGAGFGAGLFALYLASRQLGDRVFRFFPAAVVVVSASMVWWGLSHPGVKGGGIISITNYDITTGFLIFGWAVSGKWRIWLLAPVLVGLYFTGAPEALFAVVVLVAAVVIRRDTPKPILILTGSLCGIVLLTLPFGVPQQLYSYTGHLISSGWGALHSTGAQRDILLDQATDQRWLTFWRISPIKPLGYGYNINNFYRGIPHNVVLVIIEQVGVLAALAWVWVMVYGVWKTQWKYAWVEVIALSVWDHYVWTQVAPYVWVLIGVSSVTGQQSDLLYQ